jgi:hypothetical protein
VGRILKRIFIVLGGALLVLALLVLHTFYAGGAFTSVRYHALAGCTFAPLPGAAEDLQIDHATGIAYLSVFDRRAAMHDAHATGTILKLDLNHPGAHPVPALADAPPGFRPHGLSL